MKNHGEPMKKFLLVKKFLPVAIALITVGCSGQSATVGSVDSATVVTEPTASPSTAIAAASNLETMVNGKKLVQIGSGCTFPRTLAEDPLVKTVAATKMGSSFVDAKDAVAIEPTQEHPDLGGALGRLIWQEERNDETGRYKLELSLNFKNEALDERIISVAYNLGAADEKVCTWRSED